MILSNKEQKDDKPKKVSEKIKILLPELMARNSKLSNRVRNKLKVSSFLNNTENRNNKYLKSFISSSYKRVKDIKTGLELIKAVKKSSKNIYPICSQISNDRILQNSDFLIEEKKLLNENTEQETHLKINGLIKNMRNALKHMNKNENKNIKKPMKSLSQTEINHINYIINKNIKKEGDMINYKIKGYLDKLKNNAQSNKKEFNNYVENIKIFDNIKFINYTKPKPLKVEDKECASIIRIKRQLFPYINTLNKIDFKKIRKKGRKSKFINLKNISNQNIDLNISNDINNLKSPINTKNIIQKDSLKLINNLANEGRNLSFKLSKTSNKVDSLIDIDLPRPTIYEQIIEKNKENKKRSSRNVDDYDYNINNINVSDTNLLSRKKLEKIINLFKKEVGKIKNKNYDFSNIDEKNIIRNNVIYPLNIHINKIQKYCEDSRKDINRNNFNISTGFLVNKKLKRNNRNCLSNNSEKGNNLYDNSKKNNNNDSFSMFSKNRYDKSYISYSYD